MVFLRLSRVPALAIGLTLASPTFSDSGSEAETGTAMQWCYVERSASYSVPYDVLWSHWATIVTPPPGRLTGSKLASVPYFAEAHHDEDLITWSRLQHYAERATAVLFGEQPANSTTPESRRLCALLAVLNDARAWATRQPTTNPLPVLLSDETSVPQRLLFQWFMFLGIQNASSSQCRPSIELSTEIHAIAFAPGWWAELRTCNSLCSLGQWLDLVSQWLTVRALEAALDLLPSTLQWRTGSASAVETHLLFRADADSSWCCSADLCSRAEGTACPIGKEGGFAHLRLSRWMRYRATASRPAAAPLSLPFIEAALPEISKAEAVLVWVLERLMYAVVGSADGSRKLPCGSATAHALLLEPEAHGVVTCRLHLSSPPHKWQCNGSSAPRVGAPSHSLFPWSSSAPPLGRAAQAPVVAALLSWYAVDFEVVFGRLYRVWRLAQRHHFRCLTGSRNDSGAADAAAPHHNDPWRGVVETAMRCCSGDAGGSAQAHEDPVLGLLGRCLLLAMWMSLSVVDVDEGVGVASLSPPLSRKGTLYYSSRRNVLHVRDWGTALHLRYVASCLSIDEGQVIYDDTEHAGALQNGARRRRVYCRTAVKQTVSIVVSAFARARTAAAATQARARLQAQSNTRLSCCETHDSPGHTTTASRGADGSAGSGTCRILDIWDDDGAAAEEGAECVLLSWSCAAAEEASESHEGSPGVTLVQHQQSKQRTGDDAPLASNDLLCSPSLQSSWMDYSIEEFADENESTISQSPASHASAPQAKEDQEQSALDPAVVVPLLDLESHLRELLTRSAVSELLRLVGLAERLARHSCEDGEAAAQPRLVSHARPHSVRMEAQQRSWSSSALHVETVQLHEDEQPPQHAAPAYVDVSLPTPPALASTASSRAAHLREDEASVRRTLCGAEHRMRQCLHARCTHMGALLLLQSQETHRRLHLSQLWALEQEEWQMRWRTVLVPECVLRGLLSEKAAAGVWKTLPQQEEPQQWQQCGCQPQNRRLSYSPQRHQRDQRCSVAAPKIGTPPAAPTAEEARAHQVFLLYGDVEAIDREAPDRSLKRSPPTRTEASHGSPSCQRNQQESQFRLSAPLRSPSLAMWPRHVPRQRHSIKSGASRPASSCATAGAAHSAVPVLSVSLCEAPSSTPARASTGRCLNELPLNHRRTDARLACITPPSTAMGWGLLTGNGDALVNRESSSRKSRPQRHGGAHCDDAARRRLSAGGSASVAFAETICTAAALESKRADRGSRSTPLGAVPPAFHTAKEKVAPDADHRISAAPPVPRHTAIHSLSAASVPPRRLRKPVVTWLEDLQQH
ncbi:hypothetical protein MNV84_01927 [Leishmania braziliensis]|nr:hypothetical protein MNV84_01927 [Leishmania braziliensis]